jgi:putative membrane protein
MRKLKSNIQLFLKGVAMGGADVVPGVSGGTIAFITGIYGQLLDSIKSVDLQALRLLTQGKLNAFWKHINGSFLLVLLSGIALSIISLAKVLHYLLEYFPIQLWSFFFGLIIIAAISVSREIKRWRGNVILSGILGIVIAFFITEATPAETPETYWFILLSGALAICAMILPGISGSFILLILGKYAFILEAINARNLVVIAIFGLGCIVGLLSFARLVSWLLDRFYDVAIALLAGFMIGSLNKIWPWKEVVSTRINSKGEEVPLITKNILPGEYMTVTGLEPHVMQAIVFMIAGIGIVVLLEQLAGKKGRAKASVS